MDVEPDEGISSSLKDDLECVVESKCNDEEQNSPMQQSPDQSDYNENYRSPECINSVATNELNTDVSEVLQSPENKECYTETRESKDDEHSDDKMEVSEDDESENAAVDNIHENGTEGEEKDNIINDQKNLDASNSIDENGTEGDEKDIINEEKNLDASDSIDVKLDNSVGQSDSHTVDSTIVTESSNENNINNEGSNGVSSTSKDEHIDSIDEEPVTNNSLDDVSDEDSNDFNQDNTLDDVSDENSNDFNDESNVSQSDDLDLSPGKREDNKECAERTSENTSDRCTNDLTVEKSESLSVQNSNCPRTSVENVCTESKEISFSNLKQSVLGNVDIDNIRTEANVSLDNNLLDSVSRNGSDSVEPGVRHVDSRSGQEQAMEVSNTVFNVISIHVHAPISTHIELFTLYILLILNAISLLIRIYCVDDVKQCRS